MDWGNSISGLAGALIGAGAALGAQRMTISHQRRTDRHHEVAELLATYWEVTDRMWRSSRRYEELKRLTPIRQQLFRHSVYDLESAEDRELRDRYEKLRLEADAERDVHVTADAEAGVLLGRMRLLGLPLVEEADELRVASRFVSQDHADRQLGSYVAALEAFEQAATAYIGKLA